MCCSLVDADLNRPGQLAAGHLGEDPTNASESALMGVLVSSLHRLKDTNNTGTSLPSSFFRTPKLIRQQTGVFSSSQIFL